MKYKQQNWDDVLSAAARLQSFLPGAVLIGGTVAVMYASHRMSFDDDHVVQNLKQHFDNVLHDLENVSGWKTARVRRPVLILGSLDGIETGVRQLIREKPLETTVFHIDSDTTITLPTPEEILRIKAMLVTKRNAVRDYLDLVAMADYIEDRPDEFDHPSKILLGIGDYYNQGDVLRQQVVTQLSSPAPYDRSDVELAHYKDIKEPYDSWEYLDARLVEIANSMLQAGIAAKP